MINVESRKEIKKAKRQIKKQLKEYRITLKQLSEREECTVHYQTVKDAFSEDSNYYNRDLMALAQQMIEEKKNPVPVNQ